MSGYVEFMTAVDLNGEPSVLGGSTKPPSVAFSLAALPHRASSLIVVRESNEFDKILMAGMVQQTLSYCSHLPSIEVARALELRPLEEPNKIGVPVYQLGGAGTRKARTVLFEIGGDYYLYSMASAAKKNATGDNDFTDILVDVIKWLKPTDLYAASLSRLVRSFLHAAQVLEAVSRDVDRVHAGDLVLNLRGENASIGQMMWSTLAMIATSERDLIVQRLTAGLVAKYNRGEWVKGKAAVPPGFALDDERKLVVDPEQTAWLRSAWLWMAEPRITAAQIVSRLADLGVTTDYIRRLHGSRGTVADLKVPESFIKRLIGWAPLYLSGEWTMQWANPFAGAKHLAGLEVDYTTRPSGQLNFHYDVGRPNIDPALIHAAVQARHHPRAAGAAAKKRVAPLNDLRWSQDGLDFRLRGLAADTYEIRVLGASEPLR